MMYTEPIYVCIFHNENLLFPTLCYSYPTQFINKYIANSPSPKNYTCGVTSKHYNLNNLFQYDATTNRN